MKTTNTKFRKFHPTGTVRGVHIPPAALALSGFGKEDALEGHAMSDAVVLLRKEMNASELLRAADALKNLATSLCVHLYRACSRCQECSEVCPYGPEDFAVDIDLSDELRKAAGIAPDAKLRAEFGDGVAVIHADDGAPGLRDVPPYIMAPFLTLGGCPGDLDEHIQEGDVIYGGE